MAVPSMAWHRCTSLFLPLSLLSCICEATDSSAYNSSSRGSSTYKRAHATSILASCSPSLLPHSLIHPCQRVEQPCHCNLSDKLLTASARVRETARREREREELPPVDLSLQVPSRESLVLLQLGLTCYSTRVSRHCKVWVERREGERQTDQRSRGDGCFSCHLLQLT